ncbi:MAG: hypothetical protein IIC03_01080 [Proteobacteria bacterium]|nr:hypothetical protein [Pseudomonadota bacterium]
MRNLLNKATGTAIAIAAAAVLSSGSANAFHVFPDTAAVFIDTDLDPGCGVFDGEGHPKFLVAGGMPGDAVLQAVITPSGNVKLTCNGDIRLAVEHPNFPEFPGPGVPAPGRAVMFSGDDFDELLCGTAFGHTDDWQNVVTRSGRVSLTCVINGSTE